MLLARSAHWARPIIPVLRLILPAALTASAVACHKDRTGPDSDGTYRAGDATLLSTGSPLKDEDPSVLRARDGRMFIAWFSERTGAGDIYITSTADGTTWTPPVQITATATQGDFNPHLIQDDQGVFHLTWFRWDAPFRGHIMYNRSTDGLTWDRNAEVQVTTTANVDDWVPTMAQAPDGALDIYFVSDARDPVNPTNEIYVTRKPLTQTAWSTPVPVAGINSATEHDHLPYVARMGVQLILVWVRYDTSQSLPWLNARSGLYYATSAEGMIWSAPVRITHDAGNVVNLFPGVYRRHDGAYSVVWLSTRLGQPRVFALGVNALTGYPAGVEENTRVSAAGYSHRIAATSTAGVYLGAWVQGPEGAQDIHYRFFRLQ